MAPSWSLSSSSLSHRSNNPACFNLLSASAVRVKPRSRGTHVWVQPQDCQGSGWHCCRGDSLRLYFNLLESSQTLERSCQHEGGPPAHCAWPPIRRDAGVFLLKLLGLFHCAWPPITSATRDPASTTGGLTLAQVQHTSYTLPVSRRKMHRVRNRTPRAPRRGLFQVLCASSHAALPTPRPVLQGWTYPCRGFCRSVSFYLGRRSVSHVFAALAWIPTAADPAAWLQTLAPVSSGISSTAYLHGQEFGEMWLCHRPRGRSPWITVRHRVCAAPS